MIELTGYVKELEAEKTEEAQARIENIDELISKTESFQEAMEEAGQPATLSAFLEEIALVADIDSVDPDQDYVLLMTLHTCHEGTDINLCKTAYDPWRDPVQPRITLCKGNSKRIGGSWTYDSGEKAQGG